MLLLILILQYLIFNLNKYKLDVVPSDVVAGIVLVREAGGFATDGQGGEQALEAKSIICGNESIHRQLLDVLKDAAVAA